MLRKLLPILAMGALLPGCFDIFDLGGSDSTESEEEESPPAESDLVTIGVYDVGVTLDESDCGQGSVVLEPSWSFETTLSEDEEQTSIFWDSGAGPKEGTLSEDGTEFAFASSFVVDMRSPETDDDWLPPCRIRRIDTVEGEFEAPRDRASFEGKMTFRYEATEGSDCSDIIGQPQYWGTQAVLGKLPCEAAYEAVGVAPTEED